MLWHLYIQTAREEMLSLVTVYFVVDLFWLCFFVWEHSILSEWDWFPASWSSCFLSGLLAFFVYVTVVLFPPFYSWLLFFLNKIVRFEYQVCNNYLFCRLFIHFSYYDSLIWYKHHFEGWCRHQYISSCLFSVFLFEFQAPCWVCLHCLLGWCSDWLCLGRCPSLSIFLALILGFVCSIWAKFSNGNNYRGRPGERRRWVLTLYWVSCMLLQASQLHLSAFPLSAFISVTVSSRVQLSFHS